MKEEEGERKMMKRRGERRKRREGQAGQKYLERVGSDFNIKSLLLGGIHVILKSL